MEAKTYTPNCREHSPKERGLRRQSTTEEILLSRGFRRQSTTEDIMRARNYRRQSTQSEEMSRSRGRRDSSAQITDGTIATMTVETQCAFFDTSTQTGQSVPVVVSPLTPPVLLRYQIGFLVVLLVVRKKNEVYCFFQSMTRNRG